MSRMQVELGANLGLRPLHHHEIFVVGTCLTSGNGAGVMLLDIVEGSGCGVNGWVGGSRDCRDPSAHGHVGVDQMPRPMTREASWARGASHVRHIRR